MVYVMTQDYENGLFCLLIYVTYNKKYFDHEGILCGDSELFTKCRSYPLQGRIYTNIRIYKAASVV
jgi:hypothetical protein